MITNAPKQIYLNIGDVEEADMERLSDITWSEDMQGPFDIRYIRVDTMQNIESLKEQLLELLETLN